MTNEESNPLHIIEEANSKTLEYFNKTYIQNLELIQNLKTELFELEIQIETLEKTRELYTYQIDNRRNVFSPFLNESNQSMTKGKQIALQIKDLEDAKKRLEKRITNLEQDIIFFKEQVSILSQAEKCIHTVLIGNTQNNSSIEDSNSEDYIEFIETEDINSNVLHNYNILKLEDYEHYQHATKIDQNIKQEIISSLNKLDVLKWLLHSDIGRAKVTLDEIISSQKNILLSIDDILDNLNYTIDTKQPIWDQINKLIEHYQTRHPECIIHSSCDCTEYELNLPPIISVCLLNMLKEIFNNIFKHSNANKVTSKIFISSRLIDVYINDNGVGIPEDYLEHSNWYSGLHKLHEIIYQLDGKLQIQGDLISGTNVRFSFPIKNIT